MASATYSDEKYPHQMKVNIYNINDNAITTPLSVAARPNARTKTFLRLLTVAGLAVACTIAFIHGFTKGSMPPMEDGFYPNVVLKEPGEFTTMERNPAYLVEAQNGVVATENKRCSDMGVIALRKGGSAVDAAITATLCIGVVNSFSSGIGGGGFMTIREPPARRGDKSKVFTIDFRGMAPAATTPTMFDNGKRNLSESQGLSMTIPGELAGLQMAHNEWGAMAWRDLVVPNAELAMGWTVDKELARRIQWFPDLFLNDPDFREIFAPNGTLLKEGDPIERNNYAFTLLEVAKGGADAFYNGTSISEALVAKVNETGGHATVEDFKNYRPLMYRSLEGSYRGKKLYTARAPSSGPVLLHMLNLMEGYNFTRRSGLDTHRMVEAMKFGNAEKSRMSDPKYRYDTTLIDEIHTKQFADEIRERINDQRTQPAEYYRPLYTLRPDPGTSHVSVIDSTGMMVSVTSTVNWYWGAQILDPVTGIVINNQMNDFSTFNETNIFGEFPARWNLPQPGKRPLSSICPTIVENADGSPYIAIGASGGPTIFPAVFQTLINIIDYHLDPSEAIEFGRLHNQLRPELTIADETYRADILDVLTRKRHHIEIAGIYRNGSSCVQAVMRDPDSGLLLGASDSRKNGIAAGY
ncbi:gamma-glutamyltranspeptidase [Lentinula edodes]|uniref:gamma-glutamyltranspeptidase n=1 Tax=Lentinula edodes TaxID=5353 RepID=UPI001E8CCF28|nr:gamma-glutamyltranspeptidase [Lentinula edodes]KAH7879098.1 gamma-glutamyltranspeptidase [Lentinula edodes]KAJ3905769.1 gamma-glutamyltranspeptidase [Lentinula edodes]